MNKNFRDGMIASLLVARKQIKGNKTGYICHSLPSNDYRVALRVWISHQLGGNGTYGTWMMNKHPKIYDGKNEKWRFEGRLQWIDAMIEELRK